MTLIRLMDVEKRKNIALIGSLKKKRFKIVGSERVSDWNKSVREKKMREKKEERKRERKKKRRDRKDETSKFEQ